MQLNAETRRMLLAAGNSEALTTRKTKKNWFRIGCAHRPVFCLLYLLGEEFFAALEKATCPLWLPRILCEHALRVVICTKGSIKFQSRCARAAKISVHVVTFDIAFNSEWRLEHLLVSFQRSSACLVLERSPWHNRETCDVDSYRQLSCSTMLQCIQVSRNESSQIQKSLSWFW